MGRPTSSINEIRYAQRSTLAYKQSALRFAAAKTPPPPAAHPPTTTPPSPFSATASGVRRSGRPNLRRLRLPRRDAIGVCEPVDQDLHQLGARPIARLLRDSEHGSVTRLRKFLAVDDDVERRDLGAFALRTGRG